MNVAINAVVYSGLVCAGARTIVASAAGTTLGTRCLRVGPVLRLPGRAAGPVTQLLRTIAVYLLQIGVSGRD